MNKILLLITILLLNIDTFSQEQKQINNDHQNKFTDSVLYYFNKSKTANEVDTIALEKAISFLDSISLYENRIKKIESAAKQFKNDKNSKYYYYIKLSLFEKLIHDQEYYRAIDYGKEIINSYETSQNINERTLFLNTLSLLRIPFRVSDKLDEGFDYFTSKLKLYLQRNDSDAISTCYFVHGGFYRTNGLNDLAIYSFKKSLIYLNPSDTSDTDGLKGLKSWTNNTAVIGQLYISRGEYDTAIFYLRTARKSFVYSFKENSNLAYISCNIAYAKLMLGQMDSVPELLNYAYEIADTLHSVANLAYIFQIKGLYYLKINQLDSSESNLKKCNLLIEKNGIPASSTSGVLIPNYYLALIRVKQNRFKEAEQLIETEIPRLVNLRSELLKEYKLLVEVYLNLGDTKKANETFKLHNDLEDQLQADERKNRKASFETEQKIADAESTISTLITEKKVAHLTRNYLIGIVSLLLLIAIGIYNRFRVKKNANVALEEKNRIISLEKENVEREKERSENLLLNILPSEVAEELKQTGTAKAKAFTLATVMFTDFKDFTNLSEKISAELLVAEIHTCFSAFDTILQKYKIEKIKTIGDSYMCASGIPVPNYTHATDMIKAAFEIRDYMLQRKTEKEARGETPFVLRIGIHTGPVVAGIVGIKKFAYDIWGDTVNIASRMESSGEAGKVNISGSTYELVKDKFTCTHRGKIQAKNKGEIDMYFVS
jgi:class 3 adenylate cyclase